MEQPISGCSYCESTSGRLGCPRHSPWESQENRTIKYNHDLSIIAGHLKDIKSLLERLVGCG